MYNTIDIMCWDILHGTYRYNRYLLLSAVNSTLLQSIEICHRLHDIAQLTVTN